MKKIVLILSIIVLAGCKEKELRPEDFVGSWSSDEPKLTVTASNEDETYSFSITWSTTTWDYTCNYDSEEEYMNCYGNKILNKGAGEAILFENGTAKFRLKDKTITWTDEIENAGYKKEFKKD